MAITKIYACRYWNATEIKLEVNKTYKFSSTGNWKDWFVCCGAEGYSKTYLKPFEAYRRMPQAQWFSLIGSYGKDPSNFFDLGYLIAKQGGHYTATHTGELFCFANDVPCMYWNNQGYIELDVRQEN